MSRGWHLGVRMQETVRALSACRSRERAPFEASRPSSSEHSSAVCTASAAERPAATRTCSCTCNG
eukprot:5934457-Pleurochrysis_carterae.AAC.1